MWVIADSGRGINLNNASVLTVDLTYDVEEDAESKPKFVIVARGSTVRHLSEPVAYSDSEDECYQMIAEMVSDMCPWVAPSQRRKE